jgi:hypothetical protein
VSGASNYGDEVVHAVASAIGVEGYHRHGRQFSRRTEHGHAIVHVQTWRRPDEVLATLNLGVYSLPLAAFLGDSVPRRPPSYLAAHWQRRIGNLYGRGSDQWWDAADPTAIEALVGVLTTVGLPELSRLLAPSALRDSFLAVPEWRVGRAGTVLFAAILTAHLGETVEASRLVDQLDAEGYPSWVAPHLERLRHTVG